jgi:hypothetical protein
MAAPHFSQKQMPVKLIAALGAVSLALPLLIGDRNVMLELLGGEHAQIEGRSRREDRCLGIHRPHPFIPCRLVWISCAAYQVSSWERRLRPASTRQCRTAGCDGWADHTGAGWLGAILIGIVAASLTLGLGQLLLMVVRPVWARLLIASVYVAPAVAAGFYATHGIVKHTKPSETWQNVFSVIGAIAVGIAALMNVIGMTATDDNGARR